MPESPDDEEEIEDSDTAEEDDREKVKCLDVCVTPGLK